ncbi:MAG: hypothetical protein CMB41_08390 [Euryarchaeota archaeon]|nr:hypothetical protein [Euryarchaeota archaeon]|tara:strand:+ start:5084 stop:6427 length:1344 start_codon:yes stop_codon:yes gene_type:complete
MATDPSSLRLIGAILTILIGCMTLFFTRRNDKLEWNERLAAHLISWILIAKGIGNTAADYTIRYLAENGPVSQGVWQLGLGTSWMLDSIFGIGLMCLALVFPLPLLRTEKHAKVAFGFLIGFLVLRVAAQLLGYGVTLIQLPGLPYVSSGLIWGSVYVKFRLMDEARAEESSRNIANVAGMLLLFHAGHVWFMWPGMLLQAEYFYLIEMYGTITSMSVDLLWQSAYTLLIAVGLFMCGVEVYQWTKGRAEILTYILVGYFSIGLVGYPILTNEVAFWQEAGNQNLATIWTGLTTSMHFNMMRPVVMMYVILRYGLFDTSEEMKPKAKLMVIILIVIATSALLELVQALVPMNEMFSAAALGVLVAFGIGWEERSFERLLNASKQMRKGLDARWFPEFPIERKFFFRFDRFMAIVLLFFILIAFVQWQTNAWYDMLLLDRGSSWRARG